MNDPKEVETGEQYVDMALNGFFGNSGECDDLRHRNAIFMTSFSENENSLPMWNMYGKNGNGVSIGFDLELLRSHSGGTIKRCLYDTPFTRARPLAPGIEDTKGSDPFVSFIVQVRMRIV